MMFSNVIVGIAKSSCSLALSQSFCEVPASLSDLGDLAVGALDPMNLSVLPNPLTPKSDYHVTSPYNIHTLSCKQVVRLLKLIRYKILS